MQVGGVAIDPGIDKNRSGKNADGVESRVCKLSRRKQFIRPGLNDVLLERNRGNIREQSLQAGKNRSHPFGGGVQKLRALMTFITAINLETRNGKVDRSHSFSQVNVAVQNIQGF